MPAVLAPGPWRTPVTVAAFVTALALPPLLTDSRYVLGQATLACFYAVVAVQWNALFGYAGIFSMAQMALFAFGAYVTAMLATHLQAPLAFAIPAAACAALLFGASIGLACLRVRGAYLALLSFAVAEALRQIIITDTSCFTRQGPLCIQFTGGNAGFAGFADPNARTPSGAHRAAAGYAAAAVVLALTTVATLRLLSGPVGLALRALRDNETAARGRGVCHACLQIGLFSFSGFMTGLAGAVYAAHTGAIGPNLFALTQLLFIIAAVVIGGIGTFWGPVVGVAALMLLDELMREFGAYRTLGLGLIITIGIVLYPAGLLGRGRHAGHYSEERS